MVGDNMKPMEDRTLQAAESPPFHVMLLSAMFDRGTRRNTIATHVPDG